MTGKIFIFCCIFWNFAGSLAIFWPTWTLVDSLTGAKPALEFYPKPLEAHLGSTLISYNSNCSDSMTYWQNNINELLEDYIEPKNVENIDDKCDFQHSADEGKYCEFKIEALENCSPEKTDTKYGFPTRRPCIYLTLNKILDWTPRVFNETDMSQFTNEEERGTYLKMPYFLKDVLENMRDPQQRNVIWVTCEGESPADVENLGPVSYSPRRGFPAFYFPYKNVRGYQSPIVAVQFERPTPGMIINIECKAWAKNIDDDLATVRFQLLID